MAIVYGLTDQGFSRPTLQTIRTDINSALQFAFGASINVSDTSILGVIVGILAERINQLWELLEQIVSGQDPDKATGALLDAICALTGTLRPGAQPSTVTLTLTGLDSTLVSSGSLVRTASTLKDWLTSADATIVALPAWSPNTLYTVGVRVTNAGNAYQCIQSGTSASSGGPVGVDSTVDTTLDGSVFWTFLGVGTGAIDVAAASEDNGSIVGITKDINIIVNHLNGWQGVTNLESADLGRQIATDPELRQLRNTELSGEGTGPFDAVIAALEKVPGVDTVTLFQNTTDLTNADGLPPHSVEALVQGGDDDDILSTLFSSVPAGIATHGNQTGTVIDSQGNPQTYQFSRVVEVPIFTRLSISVDVTKYPGDGDNEVKTAIFNYGAAGPAGRDAVPSTIGAQSLQVPGVEEVTEALAYIDVIGTPAAWAPSTLYSATAGSRSVVTNGGRTYICIASGISASSGGPFGTNTDITDGSAHWRFLGARNVITSRQLATFITADMTVLSTTADP